MLNKLFIFVCEGFGMHSPNMARLLKLCLMPLWFVSFVANAEDQCVILESYYDGKITSGGVAVSAPSDPVSCASLIIKTGSALVCLQQNESKQVCAVFDNGQNIDKNAFRKNRTTKSLHRVLIDFLLAKSISVDAISRGGGYGLPKEKVVLIEKQVFVDLAGAEYAKVKSVNFYRVLKNKENLLIKSISGGSREWVDSSIFTRNEDYIWLVDPANAVAQPVGTFSVVGEVDKNEIQTILKNIAGQETAGLFGLLKQASWLMENGYGFDAIQLVLACSHKKSNNSCVVVQFPRTPG